LLWDDSVDVNLIIVGKAGWQVDEIIQRLKTHPQLNSRLFWLTGISDEYLEKIYDASTCLIAASEAEGFGLPLIEAAQHKLPVIARDILVFREVAMHHAFYFNGTQGKNLALAILEWLNLFKLNLHPMSVEMPWLTWSQSTEKLIEQITRIEAYPTSPSNEPLLPLKYRFIRTEQWASQLTALYELGSTIDFSSYGNSKLYVREGWSHSEDWGCWTTNNISNLELTIVGYQKCPLLMTMHLKAFVNEKQPEQKLEITVNDTLVVSMILSAEREHNQLHKVEIEINAELLSEEGVIRIQLSMPDAVSPLGLGISPDNRLLGMGVSSLQIVSNTRCAAPLFSSSAPLAQNQIAGNGNQLMLDISELCQRDAATGVQRVVRSYLKALLQTPPTGFRVVPVYATREEGYRYARRFTQRLLGINSQHLTDDHVQWQQGDIFFGLDMQHHVQLAHTAFYRQLRLKGVTVKFLVHDLLPIQLADLFNDPKAKELHEQWLATIASTDGAICVSKATAEAYEAWLTDKAILRSPNFQITWVHNGGDIVDSLPSQGLPTNTQILLEAIRSRPSFLCVSTLEPRKGQQQIVDAIQLLWKEGFDVNLVLVGQQGWKIDLLAETIRNHPEKDHRLFWLQGISDEYLEQVYAASSCLIAASLNEGFGLPLIEAARHGTPIIARDIPVFREVAGENAFYFTGDTPLGLANSLKDWLSLHQKGLHPKSNQLRWLTWQESAEKLKLALF
jgi:glycosyltransferase involved in cell wall biosynthesis